MKRLEQTLHNQVTLYMYHSYTNKYILTVLHFPQGHLLTTGTHYGGSSLGKYNCSGMSMGSRGFQNSRPKPTVHRCHAENGPGEICIWGPFTKVPQWKMGPLLW